MTDSAPKYTYRGDDPIMAKVPHEYNFDSKTKSYILHLDDLKTPTRAQVWSWTLPGPTPEDNRKLIAKDIESIVGRPVGLEWVWAANAEAEFKVTGDLVCRSCASADRALVGGFCQRCTCWRCKAHGTTTATGVCGACEALAPSEGAR